ncbi:MAG: hypothetical protein JNM17_16980 [Archangium sp.]|nr:hypothetical protein [Archangium sp.]
MRLRRNGESNPATYIVLVLLALAGWYVYTVSPVYLDNLEANKLVEEAVNQAFIDGAPDAAKSRLLFKLNNMEGTTHLELDENGAEVWKPGLGVQEDNVQFIFENDNKKLTVRVEYTRVIQYKPLKKRKIFNVVATKSGTRK